MTLATAAEAPAPALRLQGVGRRFGALQALRDVTMEVALGERRAILGPNGAGKTTLFNVVTGDYLPTSGTITLFGSDVTRLPPHRRTRQGLSRTYQSSMLFMGLTVAQSLFLAIRGVQGGRFDPRRPPADDPGRRRSEEVASLVHLADVLKAPVGSLSHGQQRQLELGMALAAGPKLLMLDEPSLGIAPRLVTLIFEKIVEINRHRGTTILLVEQNANLALEISHHGYVLETGRVIISGPSAQLRSNPQLRAAYLGGT